MLDSFDNHVLFQQKKFFFSSFSYCLMLDIYSAHVCCGVFFFFFFVCFYFRKCQVNHHSIEMCIKTEEKWSAWLIIFPNGIHYSISTDWLVGNMKTEYFWCLLAPQTNVGVYITLLNYIQMRFWLELCLDRHLPSNEKIKWKSYWSSMRTVEWQRDETSKNGKFHWQNQQLGL